MEIITSDKAPAAIGPYSQAVKTGNFLFCSGQVGIDPATKGLAGDDIEKQTLQVFKNVKEVLPMGKKMLNKCKRMQKGMFFYIIIYSFGHF